MKKKREMVYLHRETRKRNLNFKKMKLTLIFTMLVFITFGKGFSQMKITLQFEKATIQEVLETIENQTGHVFLYKDEIFNPSKKYSVNFVDEALEEVLMSVCETAGVDYEIRSNRQVILTGKEDKSLLKIQTQQQRTVTGVVTDQSGVPLPGVSIIVRGTTTGTVTDSDGNFTLTIPESAEVLQFSFVGMRSQEVAIEGRTTFTVVLEEESIGLAEVVAIGYGTQKKVNLTGSVAVASSEVFENKAVPNTIAAIQGALPGVTVTKSSGKPGSENYNIQIRGITSANSAAALVIVDGAVGSLDELNPNDIESISVLKDAAASAIYGSNAAGGVVLVTTKSGKKYEKIAVEYSGNYGITNPARMPHRLDSWVEARMYDEAHVNAGLSSVYEPVHYEWMQGKSLDVRDSRGICPNDWWPGQPFVVLPDSPNRWESYGNFDKIKMYTKRNNPVQSHNLSVRGGSDRTSYYLSAGYYNREGMVRIGPDSNDRYNIRLNLDNKFNKYVSLGTSVAYTNENIYESSYGSNSMINSAYNYPWARLGDVLPDGTYMSRQGVHPTAMAKEGGINTRNNHLIDGKANLIIENIVPGLVFNVIGSKRRGNNEQYVNRRTIENYGPQGTINVTANIPNSMTRVMFRSDYASLQAFATYDRSFADSHNFTLMGGYSYEDYKSMAVTATASGMVTNDFYSLGWSDPASQTTSDEIITYATAAVFGRLNYNYKEKYLMEVNVRYDGSSRLAPSVRWNLFPSFSVGWNIARENFFQGVSFINDLKLRASWGQLGNSQALGYYDYIGLLTSNNNLPFGNSRTQYVYKTTIASETKTWETIETGNIGVDIAMLNNQLVFSGDIYNKRNKNMLASLQVPSLIGVGLPSYNVGELETRGWEFSVTYRNMSKDFKYSATLNLSDNTNELIKYEGRNIVTAGRVFLTEGMPLGSIWGYKTEGLFKNVEEVEAYDVFIHALTSAGDMKYIDIDGNKRISAGSGTMEDHGDLVHLGDDNPRYSFGVNLAFSWKGFDFSSFLQGIGKRVFFVNPSQMIPVRTQSKMPYKEHLDYWTPDNLDAFWPRLYVEGTHSYWESDYWLQNGAYIRLKNIELGYTLPASVSQRAFMSKARIYVAGQDLWEATKTLSFYDPEYPNNAGNIYPFYRTISLGLNITF